MVRLCIICLLLALFATTGCNKAESKKAPADAGSAKSGSPADPATQEAHDIAAQGAADGEVVPEIPDSIQVVGEEGESVKLDDLEAERIAQSEPLTEEELQFIRSELIRVAPESNFTYDEEANVIMGEGLPMEGLNFEMIFEKLAVQVRNEGNNVPREAITKWCGGIYEEMRPKPKSQAQKAKASRQSRPSSGGGSASKNKQPENEQEEPAKDTFVFAKSAIGEWKSTREDHPRITTYHNDDYFEFYRFMHDGLAELKYFRDKKMVIFKAYSFDYNPRNGEISLFDSNRQLVTSFVLKIEPGNEDVLFIEFPGKDSKTVFDRIGTGYPTTENDDAPGMADFGN